MLKLFFLFLAIWWTIVNVGRVYCKNHVPYVQILIQAVGITGFVYMQFIM